jgi:hypothetical protein
MKTPKLKKSCKNNTMNNEEMCNLAHQSPIVSILLTYSLHLLFFLYGFECTYVCVCELCNIFVFGAALFETK